MEPAVPGHQRCTQRVVDVWGTEKTGHLPELFNGAESTKVHKTRETGEKSVLSCVAGTPANPELGGRTIVNPE